MNIKQYLTTVNFNTIANKENRYVVIHYTANNGDTAQGNANYFHSVNRNASANYFVDENEIVQVVKDTDIAWHCGASSYKHLYCRNTNSIGIELCSRKDSNGRYYFKDETIANAVELTASLMKKYNIPITNVIRHYDVTGKVCPEPFVSDTSKWNNYIYTVNKTFTGSNLNVNKEGDNLYQNINEVPEWGKDTMKKLIVKKCFADVNKLALTDEMLRVFVVMDRWMA